MQSRKTFSLKLMIGIMTLAALAAVLIAPTKAHVLVPSQDFMQGLLKTGDWIDVIETEFGDPTKTVVKSVQIIRISPREDAGAIVTIRCSHQQKWRLSATADYRIALVEAPD